jgi:hypothetical protein
MDIIPKIIALINKGNLPGIKKMFELYMYEPNGSIKYNILHGPADEAENQEYILISACRAGNLDIVKYLFSLSDRFNLSARVYEDDEAPDDHVFGFDPIKDSLLSGNLELIDYMLCKLNERKHGLRKQDLDHALFMVLISLTECNKTDEIMLMHKHGLLSTALNNDSYLYEPGVMHNKSYANALDHYNYGLFNLFRQIRPPTKNPCGSITIKKMWVSKY